MGYNQFLSIGLFLLVSILLSQYSSDIAQLPEWSSLKLPLVGCRGCSPNLYELPRAHEHGDRLNGVHTLLREITVVKNLQYCQETYRGMPIPIPIPHKHFRQLPLPSFPFLRHSIYSMYPRYRQKANLHVQGHCIHCRHLTISILPNAASN